MKNKILNFFSSSIRVKVTGRNVNNFIKRLIKNKINIVKLISNNYKEAELVINYRNLSKIMEYKTIYKIEIVKYYGTLKILKSIKKNAFIISFLLMGLIIIYSLSNVIFSIEVIHSNSKIVKLIENELDYYDIHKYSFVKSYKEIEKIEEEILNNNKNDLEWIEIIREGTRYIVRVEERLVNKKYNDNKVYDIVASKNAIIKMVTAESGEKAKEKNTYVRKGEVIISSFITLPNNEKIEKTAIGRVTGEVWYTVNVEYPYYYNEVIYTGKKKEVLVFNFINKRIALFDFNKYKSFNKDTKILLKDIFIPVSLVKEHQYETKVINDIYTYDTAKAKAIDLAKKKLEEKYSNIIDVSDVKIINEENLSSKIMISLFITCIEDITEYKEIIKNDFID